MHDCAEALDEVGVVSHPLVTIAIPTFNRASLLKDCVLSALAQSYPRFEVLVADNASTDETQQVLAQFTDQRLRIVRHKTNIGLLPNWNFCLAEAKAKYIVFVSDDDRIAPHMLERMVSLIEREPQIPSVLALCDVYESTRATTYRTAPSKKFGTGIWKGTDLLIEYLKGDILSVMCGILLRTDALRAGGGFPNDIYAGDMVAWAALLMKENAGFVNSSCAVFCLHEKSQTYSLPVDEHIADELRMIDAINDLAERTIGDPHERHQVKLSARRYFARRIVDILFSHRERGAGFRRELLPVIWRWRRSLSHVGASYGFKLARPICIIILPDTIVEWIRRIKGAFRDALRGSLVPDQNQSKRWVTK